MSSPTNLMASAEWLPLLAELAAKATVVLALTAAAAALLWRASAAVRHMVWFAGIVGVLALPLLSVLVPAWELRVLPAVPAPGPAPVVGLPSPVVGPPVPVSDGPTTEDRRLTTGEAAGEVQPAEAAAMLAGAGILVGLLWLAVGFWGVSWLGRRSQVVRDPAWLRAAGEAAERLGLRRRVLLLRSRGAAMPATWGFFRPSVILPATADMWPDDRRRAVLAHEMAHVKRLDCLTQAVAQFTCVLFWWHPAVWYAARRLRAEQERACDDLVLGAGARASDYATHLLEIARAHRSLRLGAPTLVSMAKPSQLESRLLSVLDGGRSRGAPSGRVRLICTAAGLLLVGPVAALRPARAAAAPEVPPSTVALLPLPEPPAPGEPLPPPPPIPAALPLPEPRAGAAAPARDTIPQWKEIEELIEMRAVGVDSAYIAQLRAAGYGNLSTDQLVEMRAVGVSGRYIAEMNGAGLGRLTPHQLVELRAVGVTPAYIAELRRHGYDDLSADEIQDMRAVGVGGEYIQQMGAAGFGRLTPDQLVDLRAVGVTPAYVEELRRHGYTPRSTDDVVEMRAVGIRGTYIEQMSQAGLGPLSKDDLTSLRAVGVTPEYIRSLAEAGLSGLSAEQLVRLKASGVDQDLIRSRSRRP